MTPGGRMIADAMAQPRNNFTVIRLVLALAVVVSHAFSVTTGRVEGEPLAASTGFTIYSALVRNWVFVVTNAIMLVNGLLGLLIVLHHRRRERRAGGG